MATNGEYPIPDGVRDRRGHWIYLTWERWEHICDEHPEMRDHKRHVFDTIRRGRRFQDSIRPDVYLYHQDRVDLPNGNTTVVVVVRFGYNSDESENNFILTAYYVRRWRATSQ